MVVKCSGPQQTKTLTRRTPIKWQPRSQTFHLLASMPDINLQVFLSSSLLRKPGFRSVFVWKFSSSVGGGYPSRCDLSPMHHPSFRTIGPKIPPSSPSRGIKASPDVRAPFSLRGACWATARPQMAIAEGGMGSTNRDEECEVRGRGGVGGCASNPQSGRTCNIRKQARTAKHVTSSARHGLVVGRGTTQGRPEDLMVYY